MTKVKIRIEETRSIGRFLASFVRPVERKRKETAKRVDERERLARDERDIDQRVRPTQRESEEETEKPKYGGT